MPVTQAGLRLVSSPPEIASAGMQWQFGRCHVALRGHLPSRRCLSSSTPNLRGERLTCAEATRRISTGPDHCFGLEAAAAFTASYASAGLTGPGAGKVLY